jgi:putative hydrolase of the HAD superfamily
MGHFKQGDPGKMTTRSYDVILFDLGGVLIELTGVPTMLAWTRGRFSESQLWDRWLSSPAVREFERGRTTPEDFGGAMVAEFGLPVSTATFLEEFLFWPRRLYPGTRALLRTLAERYTVASLSNISAMHWERVCNEMELAPCFDANFPSFETGYVKPDQEAFLHALESLGSPPERVLFMDDNAANVETARSLGMAAFTVAGLESVKSVLEAAAV